MQVATVSEGGPFSLSEMHRYRIYSEHCVACKIKKIHYRLHTFSADDCRPSRVGNCSCKKFWANEMCSSVSISPSRTCSMLFLFSDGGGVSSCQYFAMHYFSTSFLVHPAPFLPWPVLISLALTADCHCALLRCICSSSSSLPASPSLSSSLTASPPLTFSTTAMPSSPPLYHLQLTSPHSLHWCILLHHRKPERHPHPLSPSPQCY